MATTPVIPAAEPTIAELRALLNDPAQSLPVAAPAKEPDKPTPEVKTEPEKPVEAKVTEAEPGTAPEQVKEETEAEEKEEELPKNVQKRIAKEVERTTKAQRAIDEAISARKAAEAKLAEVKGTTGSEPAPTTAPKTDGKPVRPVEPPEPTLGDEETWGKLQERIQAHRQKYQAEVLAYEEKRDAWLLAEARRGFEEETRTTQAEVEGKKFLEAAMKEHTPEVLQPAIDGFKEKTSAEFQTAISQLESWPAMVIYLNKHAAELKTIADIFATNPHRGVAALGKLEAALLKPPPKAPSAAVERLPDPPAVAGGKSSAAGNVDFEKADMRTFKREIQPMLSR